MEAAKIEEQPPYASPGPQMTKTRFSHHSHYRRLGGFQQSAREPSPTQRKRVHPCALHASAPMETAVFCPPREAVRRRGIQRLVRKPHRCFAFVDLLPLLRRFEMVWSRKKAGTCKHIAAKPTEDNPWTLSRKRLLILLRSAAGTVSGLPGGYDARRRKGRKCDMVVVVVVVVVH